jgi:hypothetical protein
MHLLTEQPDDAIHLSKAAAIFGRSLSWVRTQRRFGNLEPAILNDRHAVTRSSVERLLAVRRSARLSAAKSKQRPHLRLVIDNTSGN